MTSLAVVAQPVEPEASRLGGAGSTPADRSLSERLTDYGMDGEQILEAARGVVYASISQQRIPPLSNADAQEAISELVEVALRCVVEYDESRDRGSASVPVELRFRQFLSLRMRLRLIDWLRREKGDPRSGSNGRTFPAAEIYPTDEPDVFDLTDDLASRKRIRQWRRAAEALGCTVEELALSLLDDAAETVLR